MDQWIKIPVLIVTGTIIIAVLDSANSGGNIGNIFNGFANILKAMQGGSGVNTTPNTGGQPVNTSGH